MAKNTNILSLLFFSVLASCLYGQKDIPDFLKGKDWFVVQGDWSVQSDKMECVQSSEKTQAPFLNGFLNYNCMKTMREFKDIRTIDMELKFGAPTKRRAEAGLLFNVISGNDFYYFGIRKRKGKATCQLALCTTKDRQLSETAKGNFSFISISSNNIQWDKATNQWTRIKIRMNYPELRILVDNNVVLTYKMKKTPALKSPICLVTGDNQASFRRLKISGTGDDLLFQEKFNEDKIGRLVLEIKKTELPTSPLGP